MPQTTKKDFLRYNIVTSYFIAAEYSSGYLLFNTCGERRRKFIVLFMDSVWIYCAALFANTRKVTASQCQVKKLGHSENPK